MSHHVCPQCGTEFAEAVLSGPAELPLVAMTLRVAPEGHDNESYWRGALDYRAALKNAAPQDAKAQAAEVNLPARASSKAGKERS